MDTILIEALKAVGEAYANAGWLAALATLLMFGIRIFRAGPLQNRIPERVRWKVWPQWLKWLLPFALSLAGAAILSAVGGMALWPAIIGAVVTALGSILGHNGTKMIGEAVDGARLAKDPGYVPSKWREVGSIVVPLSGAAREARQKVRKWT